MKFVEIQEDRKLGMLPERPQSKYGSCVIIAEYTGDDWDVIHWGGNEDAYEWSWEEDTLNELLNNNHWSEKVRFDAAMRGDVPVEGTTVLLTGHIAGSRSRGFDSCEYDAWFEVETFVYHIPKKKQIENVIELANMVMSAGGYCSKCGNNLIAPGWPGKQRGLCEQCAKQVVEHEMAIALDPLHDLRKSARFQARRVFGRVPTNRETWIKAADEKALCKYIAEGERDWVLDCGFY